MNSADYKKSCGITCLMIRNYIKEFKNWWNFKEDRDLLESLILEKISVENNSYEDIKKEDYVMYADNSLIKAVIPKKEWLKKLIEINFEVIHKQPVNKKIIDVFNKPELYTEEKLGYDINQLRMILKLIKYSDGVLIKVDGERINLETDEMIIILAPKILL